MTHFLLFWCSGQADIKLICNSDFEGTVAHPSFMEEIVPIYTNEQCRAGGQ